MLPPRFTSRVIARSTEVIPGTGYLFPATRTARRRSRPARRRLDPRRQLRDRGADWGRVRQFASTRTARSPRRTGSSTGTSTNCAGGPRPGARGSRVRRSRRAGLGVRGGARRPSRARDGRLPARGGCADPARKQVYSARTSTTAASTASPHGLSGPLRRPAGHSVRRGGTRWLEGGQRSDCGRGTPTRSQGPDSIKFRAARASGSTAASSTWRRPPTRRSTSTTPAPERSRILYQAGDVPGTPLLGSTTSS